MPQQSGPRNGSEEEKAALPLVTPTFSIPPHVMGRNIENPVDDLVAHGRRLQKPRLGVKVPYRNLTSQIVTQDEIAQEILERSLKKHPVHDTPERGDIFFALRLTQRLANHLTPSSNTGTVSTLSDASPGKSTPFQSQPPLTTPQSSEPFLIPDYTLNVPVVPGQMPPLADQDLLAILEGDVEPNWVADAKPLAVANTRVEHYSHHTNTIKLDPVLEKELALKQLMEFQTSSRKKKEKQVDNLNKPVRKPRGPSKKVLPAIKGENTNNKEGQSPIADSGNNKSMTTNNIATRSETNKLKTLPVKTRKRKQTDNISNIAVKKMRTSRKKVVATPSQVNGVQMKTVKPNTVKKTERKFVRKVKVLNKASSVSSVKVPDHFTPSKSENSVLDKVKIPVDMKSQRPKKTDMLNGSGNKQNVEMSSKGKASLNESNSKPKDLNVLSFYGKRDSRDKTNSSTSGTCVESMQRCSNSSVLSELESSKTSDPEIVIIDPEPHFFAPPIRTYSPKKRAVKPVGTVTSPQAVMKIEQSPSRIKIDLPPPKLKVELSPESKSGSSSPKSFVTVTKPKSEQVSTKHKGDEIQLKVEANSGKPKKFAAAVTPTPEKKRPASKEGSGKKRKNYEVERLLQDEGAINILYEIGNSDSKRRSCTSEDMENSSRPKRVVKGPLESIRRKKRVLLLKKARLVKNAVLRLTDTASVSLAPVASRMKRHPESHVALNTSLQHQSKHISPVRKKSVDSHDSLRSPPPLTPIDSPSLSQSFTYPPRLTLAAEASRIIRRHSSSSNFSSRSTSPSNVRLSIDVHQPLDSLDKKYDNRSERTLLPVTPSVKVPVSKQGSNVRKRGVPIFVRKVESVQTYTPKGKKKREVKLSDSAAVNSCKPTVLSKTVESSSDLNSKDSNSTKVQIQSIQKVAGDKKKAVVSHRMTAADKAKLKLEISKNFQKGLCKAKVTKLKKKAIASGATKGKKREDGPKERVTKVKKTGDAVNGEVSDLSSCLAAAASAFSAEAKAAKKASGSNVASHTPSPCPSRSSKSPTPSRPPVKKEPRLAAPLSPNAATYSNLIKTLENENQKQRKKDGEEITKQRSSVRQNAGTFHYHEICLRRYDNLVQVILTPQCTKMKNALNIQVLRELRDALQQLRKDDMCRAVLLTSTGSSFCQGVDLYSLVHSNAERRKTAALELAQALKDFMKCLALFNKPIVAGVHGAAVGLGVTMLPFFDMVFASDKATFYTPYAKLGQVPEGAAILTLPHMFGNAVTSELLFGCRKLTANEALHFGLVTRILWPDRFQEELIPVIRSMASQSSQSMEATKALLRHSLQTKLDAALESESQLLVKHWCSAECQASFRRFLEEEDLGLQRQRLDA